MARRCDQSIIPLRLAPRPRSKQQYHTIHRHPPAQVVIVSRNPSKAPEAAHVFERVQCDSLDRQALGAMFAAHAPYDILISSATGGARAMGPFMSMDIDGYKNSFAKLWGYANVVQLGVPHLAADGAVVLVSGAPARRPKAGQVALASVGASVEQLVRTLAPELAPRRINCVSPGMIDTPMFGPSCAEKTERLENATKANLVPRPGAPEEVADAIVFVATNRFVTGTTVDVDGGWLHKG